MDAMEDKNEIAEAEQKKFHEMGLDDRILKSIAKLGWLAPTLIQEKTIPLILDGKDVLIKARTGSGKTGAFAVPVIQKILSLKQSDCTNGVMALILAPSKELSRQIYNVFQQLMTKCSQEIKIVDISPQIDVGTQRAVLMNPPEIIVSTPSRAVLHLEQGSFTLDPSLKIIVLDEADLIFSFGHEADIKAVMRFLPRVYQAALASATLTDEVSTLKGLLLHNCVSLKLQEPGIAPIAQLVHYRLYIEEHDKHIVLYCLFRLGLVQGRSIIFVNDVKECYKLKLYLDQLHIKVCILNSELPAVSRIHALSQFNDGKYQIIITSDETETIQTPDNRKHFKGKLLKDKESGVSRGIDFRGVSNVINYSFPKTVKQYIHRVGRTARGVNKGTAISFVKVDEAPMMEEVGTYLAESLALRESTIFKEFQFNKKEVEGLEYRAREAWKVITRHTIKNARLTEIRLEIFNSKKLKHYFKNNPKDLEMLRHDNVISNKRLPDHVANVPDYLIPPGLRSISTIVQHKRARPNQKAAGLVHNKYKAKMENPLSNLDLLESNDEDIESEMAEPQHKKRHFGRRKKNY